MEIIGHSLGMYVLSYTYDFFKTRYQNQILRENMDYQHKLNQELPDNNYKQKKEFWEQQMNYNKNKKDKNKKNNNPEKE